MGVKLRQRDGAWWVFVDHHGKRKAKKIGTDKKKAQQVRKDLEDALARGDLRLTGESPTFQAFATEWLKRYPLLQPVRPNTMDNHRSFVTHHLGPYFGTLPVASISTTTVENFIVAKRQAGGSTRFAGRPLSESSLRTGLATLRLILQQAVRANHLRANPLDGLGRIKRHGDENVDPFSGAELRAILDPRRGSDRTLPPR